MNHWPCVTRIEGALCALRGKFPCDLYTNETGLARLPSLFVAIRETFDAIRETRLFPREMRRTLKGKRLQDALRSRP